jgi:hypothetical protein
MFLQGFCGILSTNSAPKLADMFGEDAQHQVWGRSALQTALGSIWLPAREQYPILHRAPFSDYGWWSELSPDSYFERSESSAGRGQQMNFDHKV